MAPSGSICAEEVEILAFTAFGVKTLVELIAMERDRQT